MSRNDSFNFHRTGEGRGRIAHRLIPTSEHHDEQDDALPDSDCLTELQCLIERIVLADSPEHDDRLELCERLAEFLDVVAKLPEEYDYSNYVNVFMTCCDHFGLLQPSFKAVDRLLDLLVDELISMMRWRCHAESFKERRRIQRREADQRCREYADYIDALFACHDRLIILRLDFHYCKMEAGKITLDMALADIDRLLSNRRSNQLFSDNVGYIIKTEFGIERGIHFHVILFFNGSRRQGVAHVRHAQLIGEYWSSSITGGAGSYWNCNQQSDEYEMRDRCGIGLIHWSDEDKRHNLKDHVLDYLCKMDQCFRPRGQVKVKLIRRGTRPVMPAVKRGRPRLEK